MPENETLSGTPILKVISEYCYIYVDDQRLEDLAHEDMPLYARRVWGYLRAAIPLFNKPARMPVYLLGTTEKPNLQEPQYESTSIKISDEQTQNYTIQLGEQFVGYELFACREQVTDELGNVYLYPTNIADYDSEAGTVTFTASEENPIAAGSVFQIDFYTDGHFRYELSPEIMSVLAVCFQYVWQNRFNTDWLSLVPKVEDRSFTEQNRANKERADTERISRIKRDLAEAMRGYEQMVAQRAAVQPTHGNLF